MLLHRVTIFAIFFLAIAAILMQWNMAIGFDPMDNRWWAWLVKAIRETGGLPAELVMPIWWTGAAALVLMAISTAISFRPSSRTLGGGKDARFTHGSARWAKLADVRRAGLLGRSGAIVGGYKRIGGTRKLRHDGPQHILCFAPPRSGKGVGLVLPTLLSWRESALVLDIKGEIYALTAGWRQSIGHRVLRFDPASSEGSVRYNPLAEVRFNTDHEIADCQNIASMIIDPDGKGLKDYWMQSGWEWLSAAVLHVLHHIRQEKGRMATLTDVHAFMSVGDDDAGEIAGGDEGFDRILQDMASYDHGNAIANAEIRRAAGRMLKRASQERSGVHSSASVQLALYSDPIVARNISECDFRIKDLMNGDTPTSLYLVIPPSEIQRLRPLIRIMMNQFLTRLTADMEFENGAPKKHYKHRLLLLLDEFTAIGKLEIFEKAMAFMAGYGLKAFIIVQDLTQLQKEYGREEAVTSNCHIRIAYAPNKIETAKLLSDMTGKTTLVQAKSSRSRGPGKGGGASLSESLNEVARPLMTPDECMTLPGLRKGAFGKVIPGDMLVFVAGHPTIYGRQYLYFQDREFKRRASIAPPVLTRRAAAGKSTAPAVSAYEAAFNQVSNKGVGTNE